MKTLLYVPAALILSGLLLMGCGDKDPDSGTPDTSQTEDALSECAEEILAADDEVYTTCFASERTFGPCLTCGYWKDSDDPGTMEDCVTCPDGYEIDVVFADCSGGCVPTGTAANPLSGSDCTAPSKPDEIQDTCFSGSIAASSCETCGFYELAEDALNPSDCVTCPDGYELDVFYGDCTGFCVAEGTAITPIAASDCEPTYECVRD